MAITAVKPTGETILFRFCTNVRGHYRSAYTRSDGTFVSDADVAPHIRCLYASIDAGLAAGGIVHGGYSVTAFRQVQGAKEVFLSRIYFRTEEEANRFVKEMSQLVNPSAKVGWRVNKLKSPKPAYDFDALDYEAKVREGIKQLRTRLGDASLDMPKVFAREGVPKPNKIADNIAEKVEELQKGLADLGEKVEKQTERLAEQIKRAVDIDENYKKIRKLTSDLINIDKTIETEQKNVETLSNRLKKLKDPEKIKQTTTAYEAAKKRLAAAKAKKTKIKKTIETINEIVEVSKKVTKSAGEEIVKGIKKIDADDVANIIRKLD
jgi:rubrerythrin